MSTSDDSMAVPALCVIPILLHWTVPSVHQDRFSFFFFLSLFLRNLRFPEISAILSSSPQLQYDDTDSIWNFSLQTLAVLGDYLFIFFLVYLPSDDVFETRKKAQNVLQNVVVGILCSFTSLHYLAVAALWLYLINSSTAHLTNNLIIFDLMQPHPFSVLLSSSEID